MSLPELNSPAMHASVGSSISSQRPAIIRHWRWILMSVVIIGGTLVLIANYSSIWTYSSQTWTQENFGDRKLSLPLPTQEVPTIDDVRQVNDTQNTENPYAQAQSTQEQHTQDPSASAKDISLALPQPAAHPSTSADASAESSTNVDLNANTNIDVNADSITPTTTSQNTETDYMQVLALTQKIERFEQTIKNEYQQENHKAQLWSRLQQLQTALRQPKNFEFELQQFSVLWPSQAKIWDDLHFLENYAKTGVPILDILLKNFSSVKSEIIQTLEQRATGWHRLRLKLLPWIQISKTNSDDLTSMNLYVLSKLEKAVIAHDLNQIIEILNSLAPQDDLPLLNVWCQHMQDYHRLQQTQMRLVDQTMVDIVQFLQLKSTL